MKVISLFLDTRFDVEEIGGNRWVFGARFGAGVRN
jgi:hypothetical protein